MLLVLFSNAIEAQDWSGNVKWIYNQIDFLPDDLDEYRKIEKIGDTLIQNRNCIIVKQDFVTIDNGNKKSFEIGRYILINENGFLEYYEEEDSSFYILYNFNLQTGDTSKHYSPFAKSYTYSLIERTYEVENNGEKIQAQYHYPLTINAPSYLSGEVIEGVGSSVFLFPRSPVTDPPAGGGLICYSEKDFNFSISNAACDQLLSTKNILSENLNIYPNPFNNHFVVEGSIQGDLRLFDSSGHLILKQKEQKVNTNQLKVGVYYLVVTIKDKPIIRKIIKSND